MLVLYVTWCLLLIPILIAGTRMLLAAAPSQAPEFRAPPVLGDAADGRLFTAVWLGLLGLSNLLLLAALAGPLTPVTLAVVSSAAAAASLAHAPTRARLCGVWAQAVGWAFGGGHRAALVQCVAASLAAATAAAVPVYFYDTGLYHYPQIKWFADNGGVPGLGLLHVRFAFVTSWLAIPATLDHGPLAGRTSSLVDGFAFAIVLVHIAVALRRWRRGTDAEADRFWACAAGGAAAYALAAGFVNSASPDLPLFFLPALVVGITLRSTRAGVPAPAVLLALLVFTIKLSALPVIAATGLFVVWQAPTPSLAKWAAVAAIIVAPMALTGIMVSGCVLFPVDRTCLDLPWSLPPHSAAAYARIITEWARWNGPTPADTGVATWWGHWGARKSNLALALLLVLSAGAGVALRQRIAKDRHAAFAALMTACGIGYVVVLAPDLRFAVGYLVLLPALLIARLQASAATTGRFAAIPALVSGGVVVALASAFAVNVMTANRTFSEQAAARPSLFSRLVVPPRFLWLRTAKSGGAPDPAAAVEDNNGHLAYRRPNGGDQCWDLPLPCTPAPLPPDVVLRRPEQGLAGGFVRE